MAAKPKAKAKTKAGGAARILETALAIAEDVGWDGLRLRDVAARLKMPPAEVRRHYRDADAIADAWLAGGVDAMLAPVPPGFYRRPPAARPELLMLRWFVALRPHRRLTAAMLAAKMWVFHPHHYVPMVFHLSRLIQWLRDTAGLDAGRRRRQVEEIGLTALFLATLAVWCGDDSENQTRTRTFLNRRLGRADHWMARLFPPRRPPGRPAK